MVLSDEAKKDALQQLEHAKINVKKLIKLVKKDGDDKEIRVHMSAVLYKIRMAYKYVYGKRPGLNDL